MRVVEAKDSPEEGETCGPHRCETPENQVTKKKKLDTGEMRPSEAAKSPSSRSEQATCLALLSGTEKRRNARPKRTNLRVVGLSLNRSQ